MGRRFMVSGGRADEGRCEAPCYADENEAEDVSDNGTGWLGQCGDGRVRHLWVGGLLTVLRNCGGMDESY